MTQIVRLFGRLRFRAPFVLAFVAAVLPTFASAQNVMVKTEVGGTSIEGKPVFWTSQFVSLLGRDGRLWEFQPDEAKNPEKGGTFQPYSQSQLRGALQAEFGRSFEVSGSGQFLVVHPVGQRNLWTQRFESLYRSMVQYFRARGFEMQTPPFPFVAVVFHHREQFLDYCQQQQLKISGRANNLLGLYDPHSNRILLFDFTDGQSNSEAWYVNAETIVHEAAHQTAFNAGIHTRFGPTPTWVVEGIGTLFEAPGIHDSHRHGKPEDRVNQRQRETFRRIIDDGAAAEAVQQSIMTDRLFQVRPATAYATAWAMTYFLAERQPRKYAAYLRQLNSRPLYSPYTVPDRVRDFQAVFGQDPRMFAAQVIGYFRDH